MALTQQKIEELNAKYGVGKSKKSSTSSSGKTDIDLDRLRSIGADKVENETTAPMSNVEQKKESNVTPFFSGLLDRFKKRGSDLKENIVGSYDIAKQRGDGEIGMIEAGAKESEKAFQILGNIAGFGLDILGQASETSSQRKKETLGGFENLDITTAMANFVKALTPDVVKEAGTEVVTSAGEKWEEFRTKKPNVAKDIESVFNIGSMILLAEGGKSLIPKRGPRINNAIVEDMISPKLGAAEKRLATAEGRVLKSKESKLFGKKPDVVLPAKATKESANIISKRIPGAEKMNEFELANALEKETAVIAKELQPKLQEVALKKEQITSLNKEWSKIKAAQQREADFALNVAGSKRLQKSFEEFLTKIKQFRKDSAGKFRTKNLDDLWEIRKSYDKSIFENVRQANKNSSDWLQYQNRIWKQNRKLLNDIINDTAKGLGSESSASFYNMSKLYDARGELIQKAPIDLRGKAGILSSSNIKKGALVGGGTYLGSKLLKSLTGR